jgi:CRP-like cAMP-binding protein
MEARAEVSHFNPPLHYGRGSREAGGFAAGRTAERGGQINSNMPELNIVEKVIALEGVDLLCSLTPEQLARIASIAQEVRFPPGKVVLEAGKPLDALYVIVEGEVELSRDGTVLTTARQNEVLGAWALFEEDNPLPVNARTVEDTRLLRIRRDDFYDLLADNSEITSAIFSTLVKRFRKLVEQ